MKTIDHLLQSIEVLAGAIQLDADNKEINLDWGKIHGKACDINIAIWEIREQLGLHKQEDLLLELTSMLDEHPEKWEGPCICLSCLTKEKP